MFEKKDRGEGFVELLIIIPVLILFIVGITQFSSMVVANQRAAMAARYGAWLLSIKQPHTLSTSQVKNEVIDFLSQGRPRFVKSRIRVTTSQQGFIIRTYKVTVGYELNPLRIYNPWINRFYPYKKFTINQSCEVVGGTGYDAIPGR
jgi:Flp pilus assembly protein TadG